MKRRKRKEPMSQHTYEFLEYCWSQLAFKYKDRNTFESIEEFIEEFDGENIIGDPTFWAVSRIYPDIAEFEVGNVQLIERTPESEHKIYCPALTGNGILIERYRDNYPDEFFRTS